MHNTLAHRVSVQVRLATGRRTCDALPRISTTAACSITAVHSIFPFTSQLVCRLAPLLELSGIAPQDAEQLHSDLIGLFSPGIALSHTQVSGPQMGLQAPVAGIH